MSSLTDALEFLGPIGTVGLFLAGCSLIAAVSSVVVIGTTTITRARSTPVWAFRLNHFATAGFLCGFGLMMVALDLVVARLAAVVPFALALLNLWLGRRVRTNMPERGQ